MKIQIKSESISEVNFPAPSFWDDYGIKCMVTENCMVDIGAEFMSVTERESDSFTDHIKGLLKHGVQIKEEEFWTAYNKTLSIFRNLTFKTEPNETI